jgi:hypothetical protein
MPVSKKRKGARTRKPTPPRNPVKAASPSPRWYVITMAGLMGVGLILVLLRFVLGLDQLWLVGGLGLIAVGFLMTTGYR